MFPRSVHARLVTLFAVGTTVLLVGCLAGLYLVIQARLDTALDESLQARGDDLVAAVAAGDLAAVEEDPLAQLYSPDGEVVVGTGRRLLTVGQVRSVSGVQLGHDGDLRVLSRRIGPSGEVLSVATSYRVIDRAGGDALLALAVAAAVLVALVCAAGWLVVRAALRPVDTLTREAAAISTLDSDRRLPTVEGDDEIARLAGTLDAMLDRLRVAFARERAFVDDASHELRTPIAVLRGEIDLALDALDDRAEVEQSLLAARGQVVRLSRLAEDLLLLARERAGSLVVRRQPVELLALVRSTADDLRPVAGVEITVDGAEAVVDADPDRLRQVVTNVVNNSAGAGAQRVDVRLDHDGPGRVRMELADDGPGFPPELLASVFDRFVRGSGARSGGGAGLGLSIVRAVVTAHGGSVDARNGDPLGGAVVVVHLPI